MALSTQSKQFGQLSEAAMTDLINKYIWELENLANTKFQAAEVEYEWNVFRPSSLQNELNILEAKLNSLITEQETLPNFISQIQDAGQRAWATSSMVYYPQMIEEAQNNIDRFTQQILPEEMAKGQRAIATWEGYVVTVEEQVEARRSAILNAGGTVPDITVQSPPRKIRPIFIPQGTDIPITPLADSVQRILAKQNTPVEIPTTFVPASEIQPMTMPMAQVEVSSDTSSPAQIVIPTTVPPLVFPTEYVSEEEEAEEEYSEYFPSQPSQLTQFVEGIPTWGWIALAGVGLFIFFSRGR